MCHFTMPESGSFCVNGPGPLFFIAYKPLRFTAKTSCNIINRNLTVTICFPVQWGTKHKLPFKWAIKLILFPLSRQLSVYLCNMTYYVILQSLKYWLFMLCPPAFRNLQRHKLNRFCQKTLVKWRMISKMSHRTTKWNECILGRLVVTVILVVVVFCFENLEDISTMIHLSWTSCDICPGFQSQGGPPSHDRFLNFISLCDTWQLNPFPTYLIKQWSMFESRRSWNHCHAPLLARLGEKWRVSTQTIQMDSCFDEVF